MFYQSTKMFVLVLGMSLSLSSAVNATIITELLFGEVSEGEFAGTTGAGSFSYDDALIGGVGEEILSGDEFSLTFTIFGQEFTGEDDVSFDDGLPELFFSEGLVVALDFFVVGGIDDPDVFDLGIFELLPATGGGFEGEVFVNTVPVPTAIWFMISGLLGLAGIANRKVA